MQDDEGYIWIATVSGLQRFDGTRFLNFNHHPGDSLSVPEDHIIQIIRDSNKHLWLLTASGLVGIFDTKRFIFRKMTVQPAKPGSLLVEKKLYADSRGNVFLSCMRSELLGWNAANNSFSPPGKRLPVPDNWLVYSIAENRLTKKIYIGTDSGLVVFNPATGVTGYRGHNAEKDPLIQQYGHLQYASPMLVDSKQRVWFYCWNPSDNGPFFFSYDLKDQKTVLKEYSFYPHLKQYHQPDGMIEQRNGTVWLRGTNIFVRYLEKENSFQAVYNGYTNNQGIAYEHIHDLQEDREENIWVATNNNGLYRFNPSREYFLNVQHMNRARNTPGEGAILSFVKAGGNTLLMSAWGNGIYRYDSNFNSIPVNIRGIIEKNAVSAWDMCTSCDGKTIWMGVQPGGVYEYDLSSNKARYYDVPLLERSTVRQIKEDSQGNLWIGTQGKGLFRYTRGNGPHNFKENIQKIETVDAALISAIAVDNQGLVWVGTNNKGVYVIDPAGRQPVRRINESGPPDQRLKGLGVSSIFIYNDTTVMIGADGLFMYNTLTQSVRRVDLPARLQPGISSMQKDRNGNLWIALTSGIGRYNPVSGSLIHFDRADGIVNDHFSINASIALPDGQLVFGSSNQFVVFDPQKIHPVDSLPDVSITGFRVRNTGLSVDSLQKLRRVELGPDDNSVTIDFSALKYLSAFQIRYKLEGIDNNWMQADLASQAVYPYLPPGTYTFKAQAGNSEGQFGKNITTLVIKIKPHFWQTWWFVGLIIFAGVGIFVWLDKLRTQKIRALESVRTRIAGSLTEDMSSSLSSINITSEMAKTKIDTDTGRTREYINQISDSSNRMVQAMYDMVWSINPANDTLQHTVERMKEYSAETEAQYPVGIVFQVDERADEIHLQMETRYEMLGIFKEALNNAARHAQAKYISVNIQYRKPSLSLCIRDDGKGFDADAMAASRGITEMRRRAGNLKALFSITSEMNTGTTVLLKIAT